MFRDYLKLIFVVCALRLQHEMQVGDFLPVGIMSYLQFTNNSKYLLIYLHLMSGMNIR